MPSPGLHALQRQERAIVRKDSYPLFDLLLRQRAGTAPSCLFSETIQSSPLIFAYLEEGILPDDESESREIVLSRSQFEVIDGILYHVEKDKTLLVIPPESVRSKLFDEAHGGQFGGHLCDAKMHSATRPAGRNHSSPYL